MSYRASVVSPLGVVALGTEAQGQPGLRHEGTTEGTWVTLCGALYDALTNDPVEDGVSHPAEPTLAKAMRGGPSEDLDRWLRTLSTPLAADLLRLIARQPPEPGIGHWSKIVAHALHADAVGMRDAAVQLIESWATPALVALLADHDEPTPWLAAYIEDVLDELRG